MSEGPMRPYRPAVITFLDILGFRERVSRSHDASEISQLLRRLRYFSRVDDPDKPMEPGEEFTQSIAFSDSVVRIRFYDTEYRTGALFMEVLYLMQIQGEMAGEDVLLRGGITVGQVYLDGNMAFGPGFNRAYDLESQFAAAPRIVIGPEAFRALRTDPRLVAEHHTPDEDIVYLRHMLRRGDDGLWFIDYLAAIRREMDEPALYPDLVARHRALIIAGAGSAPTHSRILLKYLWLAHYLNDVVDRCRLPTDLKLSQADIPALDDLLDRPRWMSDEEYAGTDY